MGSLDESDTENGGLLKPHSPIYTAEVQFSEQGATRLFGNHGSISSCPHRKRQNWCATREGTKKDNIVGA